MRVTFFYPFISDSDSYSQESSKFMIHAKRNKLSADDINLAARVKNVEPVYGYSSFSPYLWRTANFTGKTHIYIIME
jgi:transcription initiation factor TFIID subunit 6